MFTGKIEEPSEPPLFAPFRLEAVHSQSLAPLISVLDGCGHADSHLKTVLC